MAQARDADVAEEGFVRGVEDCEVGLQGWRVSGGRVRRQSGG